MDWLDVVRQLSPQQRAVEHQPETPRYSRARTKLRYVIEQATYLESLDSTRAFAAENGFKEGV